MKGLCQADRELKTLLLNDVAGSMILTKEEEYKLIKQAQSGNKEASQCLVKSNLKFVLKIAVRFWNPYLSLMDLISEGFVGIMVALKTYDPDKGFRFLTYAGKSIVHRIMDFAKRHHKHEHSSLDEPIFNDGNKGITHKELLLSHESSVEEKVFHVDIRELLKHLNERERIVIVSRYWHDLTLEETGKQIGLLKESVRRIENRALRKLRWASYKECNAPDMKSSYIMS